MLKKYLDRYLVVNPETLNASDLRDSAAALSALYRYLHDTGQADRYLPLAELRAKGDQLFTAILMAYTAAADDIQRAILLQAEEKIIFGLQPVADPTRARHYSRLAGHLVHCYLDSRLQPGAILPKVMLLAATTDDRPQRLEAEVMRLLSGYLYLYSEVSPSEPHFATLEGHCYEAILRSWVEQLGSDTHWPALDPDIAASRQTVLEDYWQTFGPSTSLPRPKMTPPAPSPKTPAQKLLQAIELEEKQILSSMLE